MHPSVVAGKTPDKPATIMAATGESMSYRELDERSNRGAQLFRTLGLKTGDGIALLMENNLRFFDICWAAQRAGLYYTCISTRLTPAEAAYIVTDSGAKVLIVSHTLAKLAEELRPLLGGTRCFMLGGTIPGYESYEDATAAMPATRIADETAGSAMLYSSGTTGRPKGVRHQLRGVPIDTPDAVTAASSALFGASERSIYLSPAPLYHAAPLHHCMSMHRLGATVVMMEHFDAEDALRAIEKHKVNIGQFVPTMFVRMLKLPKEVRERYDTSSIGSAIHAAAPCPIEIKRQMIDWWGPVLHEYYAGTEGNGFCYISSADWLSHPGSVGRSLANPIHICDEDGHEVPVGEEGTVYFEGENLFSYHNDAKKTSQSRHPMYPNWSTLGDVGRLDEEGFLYLTDRKAFMIISGGVNIYPQEAENLLIAHPKVADVAVIGVPNEDFGEEVKAVVQPADWSLAGDALAEELIAFCRDNLSHVKCPRTVDFEAQLPRHPTGKLYKRLIRDRYWGNRNSRIV